MAQLVGYPTLDLGLGGDLRVLGSSPAVSDSVLSVGPAWDSLCLSHSAPPPLLMLSLSLKKKRIKKGRSKEKRAS